MKYDAKSLYPYVGTLREGDEHSRFLEDIRQAVHAWSRDSGLHRSFLGIECTPDVYRLLEQAWRERQRFPVSPQAEGSLQVVGIPVAVVSRIENAETSTWQLVDLEVAKTLAGEMNHPLKELARRSYFLFSRSEEVSSRNQTFKINQEFRITDPVRLTTAIKDALSEGFQMGQAAAQNMLKELACPERMPDSLTRAESKMGRHCHHRSLEVALEPDEIRRRFDLVRSDLEQLSTGWSAKPPLLDVVYGPKLLVDDGVLTVMLNWDPRDEHVKRLSLATQWVRRLLSRCLPKSDSAASSGHE